MTDETDNELPSQVTVDAPTPEPEETPAQVSESPSLASNEPQENDSEDVTKETPDEQVPKEDDDSAPAPNSSAPPVTAPQAQNPGSWSAVKSSPEFSKLSSEQKTEALNNWTKSQMTLARQNGEFNSDTYQKIRAFSDKQRQDLGPSLIERGYNLAKEVAGVGGSLASSLAGGVYGLGKSAVELGASTGEDQLEMPTIESAMIKAENIPNQIHATLDKSDIASQQKDIGNLKTLVDKGNLDSDTVGKTAQSFLDATGKQWGVDPSALAQIPEYNLSSPQNLKLLKEYQDTGDPTYLGVLHDRLTTDPRQAHIQEAINNLVGSSDDLAHTVQNFTGSSTLGDLAKQAKDASTDPTQLLMTGVGGIGGSIANKVLGSSLFNAALGAGQEALTDPSSTFGKEFEAGLQGAIIPVAVHGIHLAIGTAALKGAELLKKRDAVTEAKNTLDTNPNPLTPASDKATSDVLDSKVGDINDQLKQAQEDATPDSEEKNDENKTSDKVVPDVENQTDAEGSKTNENSDTTGQEEEQLNEEANPVDSLKHETEDGLSELGYDHPEVPELSDDLEKAKTPEEVQEVSSKIKDIVGSAQAGSAQPDSEDEEPVKRRASSGTELSLNENSDNYSQKLKEKESALSPEDLDKVNAKQVEAEKQFNPDSFRSQLSNPDDADSIASAARNKFRKQLLDNPDKNVSPSTVLDSVKKDYFDKVEARSDINKDSLQSPIGDEGQTLEDTLGKSSDIVLPEETREVAQRALTEADLTPEERDIVEHGSDHIADYAQSKGLPIKDAGKLLDSALGKISDNLKQKIDEGKITQADAIESFKQIQDKLHPDQTEATNTENENQGLSQETPTAQTQSTPIAETNQRVFTPDEFQAEQALWQTHLKALPSDLADVVNSQIPSLRKLGIYGDRVDVTDSPKINSLMYVDPQPDGTSRLVINKTELAKMQSSGIEMPTGGWDAILHEEKIHVAQNEIIRQWSKDGGYNSFSEGFGAYASAFLDEVKNTTVGRSLLADEDSVYGPGLSDAGKFYELGRQLAQTRADKVMTEELIRPNTSFLRRFLDNLANIFRELPQVSYVKYMVDNIDRMLGKEDLDHLPLSPVESNSGFAHELSPIGSAELKPPEPNPLDELSKRLDESKELKGPEGDFADKLLLSKKVAEENAPPGLLGQATAKMTAAGDVVKGWFNNITNLEKYTDWNKSIGDWQTAKVVQSKFAEDYGNLAKQAIPDILERSAVTVHGEAHGDRETLIRQAREVSEKLGPDHPLTKVYERALNLSEQGTEAAKGARNYFDKKLQQAISLGRIEGGAEDYFTHVWDKEGAANLHNQFKGELASGKLNTYFQFGQKRVFGSFHDGIMAGYTPKTMDFAELIYRYDNSFNNTLADRGLVSKLFNITADDGRPIASVSGYGKPVGAEGQDPKTFVNVKKDQDMAGYKVYDHPSLRGYKWAGKDSAGNDVIMEGPAYIHPDYYSKIENLLKTKSSLAENPVIGPILKMQKGAKRLMFSIPFFHMVQEADHATAHTVNPLHVYNIDFKAPDVQDAMQHSLVLRDNFGQSPFSEGVGGGDLLKKVPVLGTPLARMSSWLFQQYIPGLKWSMYQDALDRNMNRWDGEIKAGTITQDDVKYLTAREANNAFGGLNYEQLGRSKMMQDLMSLTMLSPDFTEARARFVGQAFTKYGGEQRRALAIMGVGLFTAARLFNSYQNNGDPKWDKPFSFLAGKTEFTPRTIVGDLSEFISSFIPALHEPDGTKQFLTNRVSPLGQAGLQLGTGKDVFGRQLDPKDVIYNLLLSAAPLGAKDLAIQNLPKELQPRYSRFKDAWQELTSIFGLKFKDYTSTQEMYEKGRAFARQNGVVPDAHSSDYTDLKYALYHQNPDLAKEELQRLLKDRTYGNIQKSFKASEHAPFTGQAKLEPSFVQTLNTNEKKTYQDALQEKKDLYNKLQALATSEGLTKNSGVSSANPTQRKSSIRNLLQPTP